MLTSEKLDYIDTKRTMLAVPGTKLDDVYYSKYNSTVQKVEATYNVGRFEQTLSSLTFGGTSNILIPNGDLLGECYLHLQIDDSTSVMGANTALARGWGFAAIQSISYLFGSSNVSDLTISGQSLWQILAAQSETSEKLSHAYQLGGQAWKYGDTQGLEADILLPLPWSTMNGLVPKRPFDTSLLLSPITIKIQFNRAEAFIGGIGTTKASSFKAASVYTRQGSFSNRADSLRSAMLMDMELYYAYPFIHATSFQTPSVKSGSDKSVLLQLQQLLNADWTGCVIGVVKSSELTSSSGSVPNPFNYVICRDINMRFNGNIVFHTPGKGYMLTNMMNKAGASYFQNIYISGTTDALGVNPFVETAIDNFPILIDWSRVRSSVFLDQFQNTWREPNQTLSLDFKAPEADTSYSCFVTYFWNGVNDVQGTQSNIYFN